MKFPDDLEDWDFALRSATGPEEQFARRIIDDDCVSPSAEAALFSELRRRAIPLSCGDAIRQLRAVVEASPETFTCCGPKLPSGKFRLLFRFETVASLVYRLPKMIAARGISEGQLRSPLGQIALKNLLGRVEGKVEIVLGNSIGVVWVTDFDEALPFLTEKKRLVELLGLQHLKNSRFLIECSYMRASIACEVHVPRSLETLSQGVFYLELDCTKGSGTAIDLESMKAIGLPEAIHRGCAVVPHLFRLATL